MKQTVSIQELQARASELLAGLGSSDEIIVAKDGMPVAKIQAVPHARKNGHPPEAGFWKGQIETAADFDEPLPDSFWAGEE